MLTFKYPYTNFSEVNLDYVLSKMRETVSAFNALEADVKSYIASGEIDDNNIITLKDGNGNVKNVLAVRTTTPAIFDVSYGSESTHDLYELVNSSSGRTSIYSVEGDPQLWFDKLLAALKAGNSVKLRYTNADNKMTAVVNVHGSYSGPSIPLAPGFFLDVESTDDNYIAGVFNISCAPGTGDVKKIYITRWG